MLLTLRVELHSLSSIQVVLHTDFSSVVSPSWQEKNSPEGLVGVARRFVKFGGGVSSTQLEWLEQQIKVRDGERRSGVQLTH